MKKQARVVGIILVVAAAVAIIYFGDFDGGLLLPSIMKDDMTQQFSTTWA